MDQDQIYRGVRDAFAPPNKQPYRDAVARIAKEPPPPPAPRPPLLEDDASSWAAPPDDSDLASRRATTGSLVIVDTGVMAVNQLTVEGKHWIEQSDRVLFLGADPVTERWIQSLNENLESLSRLETSDEIVERSLDHVRAGLAVCIAIHGRSTMSEEVSREAIGQGRAEGFPAVVVSGVSALDCLSTDLGLDLAQSGCQIFAAEAFLERRQPDPSVALVLHLSDDSPFGELLELLRRAYGAERKAVLYEPARYAVLEPVIQHCAIGAIDEADLARISIFYVPPKDADG
jgi:Tetrapyrrole (Corrin/Porphyrin) Methylases